MSKENDTEILVDTYGNKAPMPRSSASVLALKRVRNKHRMRGVPRDQITARRADQILG